MAGESPLRSAKLSRAVRGTLSSLGFIFGGRKCTGRRRVVNITGRGFYVSFLRVPASRRHGCPREAHHLSLLLDSPPLSRFSVSQPVWDAHLLVFIRAERRMVTLGYFRKVSPRRASQRPLRHLHLSRSMSRNKSPICLPPCKPCEKIPRSVQEALQIPIPSVPPPPAQPTEK